VPVFVSSLLMGGSLLFKTRASPFLDARVAEYTDSPAALFPETESAYRGINPTDTDNILN